MGHTTRNGRTAASSGGRASLAITTLLMLAPVAGAQETRPGEFVPRWTPDPADAPVITPGHDLGRIVLKALDDSGLVVNGGALVAPGHDRAALDLAQLVASTGARASVVFDVPHDELARMRRDGERNVRARLADLSQYFFLDLDGADPIAAIHELSAHPAVEEAYFANQPPPTPGDVFPATPSFDDCAVVSPCQGYMDPAPSGIGARWAHGQTSGRGARRRIADIEYAWNLNGLFGSTTGHEDLGRWNASTLRVPIGPTTAWTNPFPGDTNHGTAVIGVLSADRDAWGVTGVADEARLRVAAAFTSSGLNVAGAVLSAARRLRPGDSILIEMQMFGPNYPGGNTQRGMVPVEYYGAEYSAIRQATALCIHVIEAAGNGEQDLDSVTAPFGHATYPARFDGLQRHSGAVLVGAGTRATPHLRMWFSNHGERVDAYAWGEHVVTLGYGDLWDGGTAGPDVDQLYTSTFAGTSSASAIVAGAATVLNGKHEDAHGVPWRPAAMTRFLRTSGTRTSTQFVERIGRQPDLEDQMRILGMGPDPALVFTDEGQSPFVLDVVETLGDVDGDGTPDYAVGSGQAGATGRVTLYSGRDGRVLLTRNGGQIGEKFGRSLAGGTDVDADGVPDLIVGSSTHSAGGTDAGRVTVLSGANFSTLRTFDGSANSNLGFAVAAPGDLDGDGYADVVAGQFGFASGRGRVLAWSGRTGAVLHTWDGLTAGDHFGQAVAAAGDVNADGTPDVIVGAPFRGGLRNGEVRVFSGADGALLRNWTSWSNYAWFGFSVDGVGDLDGDGSDDVIVGAPNLNGVSGAAHVYSGATGLELFQGILYGGTGSNFGASVAGVGDQNGDGTPDFAVGAPLEGFGPSFARGGVQVYDGATGAWLRAYVGQSASSYLGTSVCGAGDLDGDGREDLFVGAQWWSTSGAGAGRGYVFLAPEAGVCGRRNRVPQ